MKRLMLCVLTFTPLLSLCFGATVVSFVEEPGKIRVLIEGKPFGALFCAKDQDKPFLFPLRSADGVSVVRGWPVEPEPGDSTDHAHQRGLWWAHGLTNGVDFWTNGKNTGRYELKAAPKVNSRTGTIRVDLSMVAPTRQVLGSLVEEYTFAADGENRIVDVTIQILADRGQAVKLGDTREGVMGVREK